MMNLNLYNHLKLASELSEAVCANHATHLEHRSLDAILELIAIIRQEKTEDTNETNIKADPSVRISGDLFGSTLGYGRKSS
jgi:hypothetical protein